MEKINKVTLLGVVCAECGAVTSDAKVLRRAVFRSWVCPACRARNLSRNDAMAAAKVTASETEPALATDANDNGEENCRTGFMEPQKLQRLREEFVKRGAL